MTYARRYSISMALGIVADDDDDANLASGVTSEEKERRPAPAADRESRPATPPAAPSREKEEKSAASAAGHEKIIMVLHDVKFVTGTASSTGREWQRWDLIGKERLENDEWQKIRVSTFDSKLGEKAQALVGKTFSLVIKPGRGESLDLVAIKEVVDELPF